MFGAMNRAAERWRSIEVTDFERHRLEAVRQDLTHEYEATTGLDKNPSCDGRSLENFRQAIE